MHFSLAANNFFQASIISFPLPKPPKRLSLIMRIALPGCTKLSSHARGHSFPSTSGMGANLIGNGFGFHRECCSQLASQTALSNESMDCPGMGVVLPATEVHVKDAVSALKNGQVIAVPTDTLYGFAVDACSEPAVRRIYEIKGRSSTSPLALCVAHLEDLEKYSVTSYLPKGLVEELLPGPVTLVLQRGKHSLLEKSLNPGLASIGIRIPDCAFIRQVAQAFGGALALTSANLSGQPSTVRVQEFEQLWVQCAYVFDAGEIPAARAGSTIVDLTVPGIYKIIRAGSAFDETAAVLSKFDLRQATSTED